MSDFFNGGGTVEAFRKLMKSATPDEVPIELHHLLDIEDPKYDSKLVSVEVVVLGMNSNSFHATKKFRAVCNSFSHCKIADCPLKVNEGVETFTLERDSREYINSIQATDLMIVGIASLQDVCSREEDKNRSDRKRDHAGDFRHTKSSDGSDPLKTKSPMKSSSSTRKIESTRRKSFSISGSMLLRRCTIAP